MAGIGALPGIREQVGLVARLRWNLFRNSLRTLKGRLEALSIIFLWLTMSGLVLGGGAAMGIGAYLLVARGYQQWLPALLWIVFLYWQLSPLFAASVGFQFDFSNLLRFPLRYSSFFVLNLAYGLFDPGAVGSVFWLGCLSIGVGVARPAMFPWALLIVVLFAAMNLFLGRVILTWTERWLAQRKTREVLGFIFILLIIGVQFIGPAVRHFQHSHARPLQEWIATVLSVAHYFPPGFAGVALTGGLNGSMFAAVSSLLFLGLYTLAFFWMLRVRLVAEYHGELISETVAVAQPEKARTPGQQKLARDANTPWRLAWPRGATGAILEKEIRYALRSGPVLLSLLVPILVIVLFKFNLSNGHQDADFLRRARMWAFPAGVGYALLIQTNFVFNSFAFEGTGIQFLLVAPVRFTEVMAGKNLFLGMATLFEAFLIGAGVTWVFQAPQPVIVVSTLCALLYATLANFAVGNILSVCFPRRLEFGVFRQKRQAGVTVVAGLVTQVILLGSCAAVFFLTAILGRIALAIPIFLAMSLVSAAGYKLSQQRIDRLVLSHRETLTAELCRAE